MEPHQPSSLVPRIASHHHLHHLDSAKEDGSCPHGEKPIDGCEWPGGEELREVQPDRQLLSKLVS